MTAQMQSHPRRQVGEFLLAAQHGLQFSEFLVAPVIAAFFDVFGSSGTPAFSRIPTYIKGIPTGQCCDGYDIRQ